MAVLSPAVPASTVVVTNPTGQTISATITGGTVSNISVNGATVASGTPANVSIPPGGTISITYTVAPSWAWTNPPDINYTPGYGGEDIAAEAPAYNPDTVLPYAPHGVLGFPGYGLAVSN